MAVQAWFSQEEVFVRPGESTSLSLAIENVGEHTVSYTVVPAGLSAAWTTVTRPNVTVFEGSRDVVEVVVRPPAIHSTGAGPTSVTVRVVPADDPEGAIIAETVVTVRSFDDRRIVSLQPVRRARRRATFEFMVENHGNNLASCRLHLVDATDRVDGSFDPPAVGVAPGSSNLVRLSLRTRGGWFRRAERQLDFEIEATEPDHEPAVGRATLVQPPTVSLRSIASSVGVAVALVVVAAAWFGVVRPTIRDAAADAVDDRVAELGATAELDTDLEAEDGTVPASTAPVVGAGEGEPVAWRLTVDAGIATSRSESISIPPDARFALTDVVLQNPHGDLGAAQLLRNGDVLYEWDLGSTATANEFQPRITPIPFAPGDNVVLAIVCDVAGDTTGTGCEISVLLGGRLTPIGG
jgi:hypothetical protein